MRASAGLLRLLGDAHGVRPHIGDEGDMVAVLRPDALVQMLGEAHRLGGGKAELVGGVLLHRAGRERRGRVRFRHRLFHLGNDVFPRLQLFQHLLRFLGGSGLVFFCALLFEQRLEGGVFLRLIPKLRRQVPILLRLERLDFPFPLDDEAGAPPTAPSPPERLRREEELLSSILRLSSVESLYPTSLSSTRRPAARPRDCNLSCGDVPGPARSPSPKPR